MAASEEDQLLQESLCEFSEGLESLVPLRHYSEHKDEARIEEAVQLQSEKVFTCFDGKLIAHNIHWSRKGDLMNKFWSGVDSLTKKYLTMNQDCKAQSELFLENRMNACCEDFRLSIEAKLLMNPDMDLDTVEEFFKKGKLNVINFLEHFWKHGNVSGFEEQKTILKEKLDTLKIEFVEKQRLHLQIKAEEEARKSLEEVEKMVLEMAMPIECDIGIDTQPQGTIDIKTILKAKVAGIHDYLLEKRKIIEEKYGKLCLELLDHLKDSMKFLEEEAQVMSVEDEARWMERLNQQLQYYFVENDRREQTNNVQETGKESEMLSNDQFVEMCEDETFEVSLEVEPEETKLEIVEVRSIQPETQLNNDGEDGDVELNLDSASAIGNEVNLAKGVKRHHQIDLNASATTSPSVTPSPSKKLKQLDPDNLLERESTLMLTDDNNAINVSGDDGEFPLLCVLREGQSIECIRKMLENGANVNIKGNDGRNAAHVVVKSLIKKRRSTEDALAILSLLVANDFNLINDGDNGGHTPLHYAVHYEDLTEEILRWFFDHGADFNAAGSKFETPILFYAIQQQCPEIIRKIIDFGGNPKYINKRKWNALHVAARYGNDSALEIFIDKLDVNEVTKSGDTPLHLLFAHSNIEYGDCLEILIKKGADFNVKCNKGYTPLEKWMCYEGNPFPVLVKLKDMLPISEEIASSTFTFIIGDIESKKEFLPFSSGFSHNGFVQFILFLVNEKKAKLLWNPRDEKQWKLHEWKKLDKVIFTRNFFRQLKAAAVGVNRMGNFVGIKSGNLGELELQMQCGSASVQLETILACMLACKNYQGFVVVCRFLSTFFASK